MKFRVGLFWTLIVLINIGFLGGYAVDANFIHKMSHPLAVWVGINALLCLLRQIDKWIANAIQQRKQQLKIKNEKENVPNVIDALIAKETEDSIVKKVLLARKSCVFKQYDTTKATTNVATPFDITQCISEKEERRSGRIPDVLSMQNSSGVCSRTDFRPP